MTNKIGFKNVENEYKNYLGKYVIISVLPNRTNYYGFLKSFENRKAVFNPYRGEHVNDGKLEETLLEKDLTVEFRGLNISIEETSEESIRRWCELTTMKNEISERELIEKYKEKDNSVKKQ